MSSWPSPSSPGTTAIARALHRHDRDALVLEAAAHDDLGAGERIVVVGSRLPHDARWSRSPRTAAARRARAPPPCRSRRGAGRSRRSTASAASTACGLASRRRPRRPCRRRSARGSRERRARDRGVQLHEPGVRRGSRGRRRCTRATTPGIARASRRVDRPVISACAIGERTNARCEHAVDVEVVDVGARAARAASGPRPGGRATPTSEPAPNTVFAVIVRLLAWRRCRAHAGRARGRGAGGTRATRSGRTAARCRRRRRRRRRRPTRRSQRRPRPRGAQRAWSPC